MCTTSTTSTTYNTSTAWYSWVTYESSSTNSSCTSSASDGIWYTWTSTSIDTSTSTDTCTTWNEWVEVSYSDEETETPYVIQEQDQSNDHYKKVQDERNAAEVKATELLEILIGKEQVEVYKETGRVFLKGKKFDYHIVKGSGFNIRKIEKDKVRDLCVHLRDRNIYPDTDNVVALLLALQDDEEGVLDMANDHGNSRDTFVEELPMAAIAGC